MEKTTENTINLPSHEIVLIYLVVVYLVLDIFTHTSKQRSCDSIFKNVDLFWAKDRTLKTFEMLTKNTYYKKKKKCNLLLKENFYRRFEIHVYIIITDALLRIIFLLNNTCRSFITQCITIREYHFRGSNNTHDRHPLSEETVSTAFKKLFFPLSRTVEIVIRL